MALDFLNPNNDSGRAFLGRIGLGGGLVGSILDSVSSFQASSAAADELRFRERIAKIQASNVIDRGRFAEQRFRQQIGQLKGRQRAVLAAQGADLSKGTAGAILEQTAVLGELDALAIRNNTALEAWGLRGSALGLNLGASEAESSGFGRSVSTLLTGLSDTALGSIRLRRTGVL